MRILPSLLSELPLAESEFEQQVFDFCQLWRSGAKLFLFHSSGSTGDPKPIQLSREQLYSSAKMTGDWLNLGKGDVALLSLSPSYIAGAMVLVRAFIHELSVILVEPCQNPLVQISPISIHLASFVPTQWSTIIDSGVDLNLYFKEAKGILLGGASVPDSLRKKHAFPVYETYGMTETVSHIAYRTWNQSEFLVLPGVQIAQNDENCLLICAPMTENKWIETRDVVEIREVGRFNLMGRLDRIINSGGIKIQPEKIEEVYRTFIDDPLFVAGVPDKFWGQKVVLFIEAKKIPVYDEKVIHELLNAFEIPKQVICLPSFIKTPSAKIDTLKTVALYLNSN